MLRPAFYAQESEKRLVKIEYRASRSADCRRQNDAGGIEGVSLDRSPRGDAAAGPNAQGPGGEISEATRGWDQLPEIPARLPARDGRMGGQREEGRDASQAPGQADRAFGAQPAHRLYVNHRVHEARKSGVTCSHTFAAMASGVPRPSINRSRCGSLRASS